MAKNQFHHLLIALALIVVFPFGLMSQNCHVSGRVAVPELQGKKIVLLNMNTGEPLATTKIVDSTFSFDVDATEAFVGMLKTDPKNSNPRSYYYLRFVGEAGDLYADLVTDSLSGTPLNDKYYQYANNYRHEMSVLNAIYSQMNESVNMPAEERMEMSQRFQKNFEALLGYEERTFVENKSNPIGALAIEDFLEYADISYESVLEMLIGSAQSVITYQPLQTKLAAMEKVSHTAPGKSYIDLDLKDYKTGKPVKLSKVIDGKVALIDFWASWCRPCRAEIPNLAEIHKKYGGKEFVLVSLNVWDKPDGQAKAIKDLNMVWTQLTDATRHATDVYAVDGIPQILLIGKDGKIIARDLRGEDIEAAVKKALGK